MKLPGLTAACDEATPLWAVSRDDIERLEEPARGLARLMKFDSAPGGFLAVSSGPDGRNGFLTGAASSPERWSWSRLAETLPPSVYAVATALDRETATEAAIGWALAAYRFRRGKGGERPIATLVVPENADLEAVQRTVEAVVLGRDMVNHPANVLGPAELADVVVALGRKHGAETNVIIGQDLAKRNYPAIHAVGASSHREPRLIDLTWGNLEHPKVTLVGKGVCFDTGGLNLKSMADMRNMKRDMGGAAVTIALASMVMAARLPVRLRLLVPAVDNVVGPDAFRPGDIVTTRLGITSEIANTDCEGRLVLADALAAAGEDNPEIVIDAATLTGSARVALGGELGAFFCSDEAAGFDLQGISKRIDDPLWMLPLWKPYRTRIAAPVGDLLNMADGAYAGAITAALFLQEFVKSDALWIHLDISAWNDRARPGRPVGGEVTGSHALFHYLLKRYGGARPG